MKAVLPALHTLLAEDRALQMVDGMAGRRMTTSRLQAELLHHFVRVERRVLIGVAAAVLPPYLPSIG